MLGMIKAEPKYYIENETENAMTGTVDYTFDPGYIIS